VYTSTEVKNLSLTPLFVRLVRTSQTDALRTDEAAWIRGETSSRQNQSPVAYDLIVARMELTWINENIHRSFSLRYFLC